MTTAVHDGAARLATYTRVASASAARVIQAYSTSFGVATSLLPARCRPGIRAVYALVRVADEVVDGVAAEAGLSPAEQQAALAELQAETHRAITSGFSTNLVVHAFAATARTSGITRAEIDPFFASMAMDLTPRELDDAAQATYVFGSAEVVGLMCLRVFLAGRPVPSEHEAELVRGARALGAAFQNVNFLRDLADDSERLGRDYLPTASDGLDEDGKRAWVARVEADLATADAAIALLPADVRPGVRTAWALFGELARRVEQTPAAELAVRRISVPTPVKLRLTAASILGERVGAWRASR